MRFLSILLVSVLFIHNVESCKNFQWKAILEKLKFWKWGKGPRPGPALGPRFPGYGRIAGKMILSQAAQAALQVAFKKGFEMAVEDIMEINLKYDYMNSLTGESFALSNVPEEKCDLENGKNGQRCYRLSIETKDELYAGTNSKISIRLSNIDSTDPWKNLKEGKVTEYTQLNSPGNDFERGNIDHFFLLAQDMGNLTSVTIKHEGKNQWKCSGIKIDDVSFPILPEKDALENIEMPFPSISIIKKTNPNITKIIDDNTEMVQEKITEETTQINKTDARQLTETLY